ncbi:MAG: MFS transporter [Clostridia bacterium]|nr:MFS transporter [Clostridia bacterium]
MKLNYKRTIFVGFAFFLIIAFWQAYDTIVPKILTDKFGLSQTWSGAIMAMDNIFALFLLPLFGALSDKLNSRFGRRTPFVVIGTLVAAVLLITLSFADGAQRQNLGDAVHLTDDPATDVNEYVLGLETVWDANPNVQDWNDDSLSEHKRPLQELISREEFVAIPMTLTDESGKTVTNTVYKDIVVPARQAYAAGVTSATPGALIAFMILLFFLLVAMGTFRSPAVALMPDVTVRPLRSKGNAIINLMGTVGGICILLLGTVLGTGSDKNALMSYTGFFATVAALMLVALGLFLWRVREQQWAAEMEAESAKLELDAPEEQPENTEVRKLSRGEKLSLLLILASVAFWYMGYNAVTSKYSVYAGSVLGMDYNTTLLLANAAGVVSYIPVGLLSSRFGRKKMILGGVLMLGASFLIASFMRADSSVLLMNLLFILAGIGWATINVNSYPMAVELARGSQVGKYTGYYYTASMAAQVITPVLSGVFLDIRLTTLFPYATIFVALSFVTMLFVRHGDVKPEAKQTILDGIGGD